jgi:hypothetical protein
MQVVLDPCAVPYAGASMRQGLRLLQTALRWPSLHVSAATGNSYKSCSNTCCAADLQQTPLLPALAIRTMQVVQLDPCAVPFAGNGVRQGHTSLLERAAVAVIHLAPLPGQAEPPLAMVAAMLDDVYRACCGLGSVSGVKLVRSPCFHVVAASFVASDSLPGQAEPVLLFCCGSIEVGIMLCTHCSVLA